MAEKSMLLHPPANVIGMRVPGIHAKNRKYQIARCLSPSRARYLPRIRMKTKPQLGQSTATSPRRSLNNQKMKKRHSSNRIRPPPSLLPLKYSCPPKNHKARNHDLLSIRWRSSTSKVTLGDKR